MEQAFENGAARCAVTLGHVCTPVSGFLNPNARPPQGVFLHPMFGVGPRTPLPEKDWICSGCMPIGSNSVIRFVCPQSGVLQSRCPLLVRFVCLRRLRLKTQPARGVCDLASLASVSINHPPREVLEAAPDFRFEISTRPRLSSSGSPVGIVSMRGRAYPLCVG